MKNKKKETTLCRKGRRKGFFIYLLPFTTLWWEFDLRSDFCNVMGSESWAMRKERGMGPEPFFTSVMSGRGGALLKSLGSG